ncbi:DUF3658 domain-containing protein [Methanomicrobium sp. W14]|uniref:DUF3658 domain-containing protein n=1 Tax=Methanomicrobium sp. W14 TaxID=2817839 RepID=UPI0032AF0A0E
MAFSESAGGMIKHSLGKNGNYAFTVMPDDLGVGPLKKYDIDKRIDFFSGFCRESEYMEYAKTTKSLLKKFRDDISGEYEKKVLWFSRRSVQEYCGFLRFISEQDNSPQTYVIDLTDGVNSVDSGGICGSTPYKMVPAHTGELNQEQIVKAFEQVKCLKEAEKDYYTSVWKRLKKENANIRKLWRSQIYSAPDCIYDRTIIKKTKKLSREGKRWVPVTRIVGDVLGSINDECNQAGYALIFGRLIYLCDSGVLKDKGKRKSMRTLKVKNVK